MKKYNILILFFCVTILSLSVSAQEPVKIPPPLEGKNPPNILDQAQKLPAENLDIVTANGNTYQYSIEVADDDKERTIGLMFRNHIPPLTGMLFWFKDNAERHFWMRNTFVPLDILFIREDGIIHHIHHNAIPHSLELIKSNGEVSAVLEIAGGEARRNRINIGDRVILPASKHQTLPKEKDANE